MKLIDKYISRTMLHTLVYVYLAFIILFIVHDLFSTLPDFVDAEVPGLRILKYYLIKIPSVIVYITPITMLLTVLYSLYNMTHSNELTAMRASGISLYRLILPIIAMGFLGSIGVLTINETMAPKAAYWSHIFDKTMDHTKDKKARAKEKGLSPDEIEDDEIDLFKGYGVPYRNQRAQRNWYIEEFDTRNFEMTGVTVTQERPNGFNEYKIVANRALWLDGTWWFTDLSVQKFSDKGHQLGFPELVRRREMNDFDEKPLDFLKTMKDPAFLSAMQLHTFLEDNQTLSEKREAQLRTDFHFKLGFPWACLIVTILGVPFGHTTARKGILLGIVICLALFFSYFFFINIMLAMGKFQRIPSWLAVWTPNIVYLFIGLILLKRMR